MTADEVRELVDAQREKDTMLGAILTIMLDKLVALDRELKELRHDVFPLEGR